MLYIGNGDGDRGDRGGDAEQRTNDRAVLATKQPIVFDAEFDAGEQIVAFADSIGAVSQSFAESLLGRTHGSAISTKRDSRAARPRCRWVFTELRDTPSDAAISSMPSSS